jgi:acetyl esterase/lipase
MFIFLLLAYTQVCQADKDHDFAAMGNSLKPDKVITYKKVGDKELTLHLFYPKGYTAADTRPAFVTIHGGGWRGGTPQRFYPYAKAFADQGFVGISVQYRLISQPEVTVFDCVKDGRAALRYVRAHAKDLGIDPGKITVSGGSAGGHVAAGTALFDGIDHDDDNLSVSCLPNAMVLLFPVIDTSKEQGYGNGKIGDRWESISPAHQVKDNTPPTLIFHGMKDTVTPYAGAVLFKENMNKHGNICELVSEPNAGHGHINNNKTLYDNAILKAVEFIKKQGFGP